MTGSWDDDDDYAEVEDDWPLEPDSPGEPQLLETLLFTATNPPGTVSVSTMISGLVVRVDLSPEVVRMTESQLSEEITVISRIARLQAQAAQHALAANMMHKLGHDTASTRGFLETELGLPAPQTVLAERLALFKTRYTDEQD